MNDNEDHYSTMPRDIEPVDSTSPISAIGRSELGRRQAHEGYTNENGMQDEDGVYHTRGEFFRSLNSELNNLT